MLMIKNRRQQCVVKSKRRGFAVLSSVILLSLASIMFTTHMVSSQLIDNKIIANYYRNAEALANAESGVNFILAQLDDTGSAQTLLTNLPFEHYNSSLNYHVTVEEIQIGQIRITANGTSSDGSAKREINVDADFYLNFPIPEAAISTNGKLALGDLAVVNDGCEGLGRDACLSKGNIAPQMLVSNPGLESDVTDDVCSSPDLGESTISPDALRGESEPKLIQEVTSEEGVEYFDWGDRLLSEEIEIGGVPLTQEGQANSLFEMILGFEMSEFNLDNLWNHVTSFDMSSGGDCSDVLQSVTDEDNIIYIKGDCIINEYYALDNHTFDHNIFSIGSNQAPKLVLLEGGTFVMPANMEISIVGMLYLLPSTHDSVDEQGNTEYGENGLAIQLQDPSINLAGIHVDGALLSEYHCSHDGVDNQENYESQSHLSARFNKQVLNQLYSTMGIGTTGSGYRLSAGTWKDF